MKIVRGLIAAAAALLILLTSADSAAAAVERGSGGGGAAATAGNATEATEHVPGEVIVRFEPASAPGERARSLSVAGSEDSERLPMPRTRLVELEPGSGGVDGAVRSLSRRDDVLWAEPNYLARTLRTPDDPEFGELWGMSNTGQSVNQATTPGNTADRSGTPGIDVGATEAWDQTIGSRDVLVGVIDTGIAEHSDLNANLRTDLSRDFRQIPGEAASPFADADGHGTHVAGTIGAVGDNGAGVGGVNWRVGLVALRALDAGTGGAASIAAGLAYAGQLGLPVVNVSVGVSGDSRAIRDAIRLAPGTLVVAAAGNEAANVDETPTYPCAYELDNVLCVAAIGNTGNLAWFSNFGSDSVDLGAPGNQILSTYPGYDEAHDFPFDPADFGDDWDTGPDGEEWGMMEVAEDDGTVDVLSSNPDGELADGTDSFVVNESAVDLSGRQGCTLRGWVTRDFAPPEGDSEAILVYEVSINSGISWRTIGLETADNAPDGAAFKYALNADGEDDVFVRIRLVTQETVTPDLDGAQFRALWIRCQDPEESEYELESGTSMAAPHVAGGAALLLSEDPGLSTDELRDALVSTARATSGLAGTTVTGGRMDLPAALAAIEPPAPPEPPEPDPPTRLRMATWPGHQDLRRNRGLIFHSTTNHRAGVTARADISWRRQKVQIVRGRAFPLRGNSRRSGPLRRPNGRIRGRIVTVPAGTVRLARLAGGWPARWNPRARVTAPGHITTLRLLPRGRQIRRLIRLQRLQVPLGTRLLVRGFSPGFRMPPLAFHRFRIR